MPRISIVVPVYNSEGYLSECIDSILSQSYSDFELILIDDGSSDSSGKICDAYSRQDERIRVFHQINGGVTSARKKGVYEADADWISFVDADDKLESDCLKLLYEVACDDKDLDIIEGAYTWFYPDGKTKLRTNLAHRNGRTFFTPNEYSFSLNLPAGPARGPWAKLIRKELLISSGALEIPRRFTNREDVMMLTMMSRMMHKAILLSDPVYQYRQQFGESAISNKLSFDYWSEYLNYTECVVLQGLLPKWDNVWSATIKSVFGIVVHSGYIKSGSIPIYFKNNVLPILLRDLNQLHRADRAYVRVLSLPQFLRNPICVLLHLLFRLKTKLLGHYFALKSRK